jgi:hypothetical protein
MADAAATTVETWWNQGFFPEKDVAFRALVADYESRQRQQNRLRPRPKLLHPLKRETRSTRRSFELKARLRCYASLPLAIRPAR